MVVLVAVVLVLSVSLGTLEAGRLVASTVMAWAVFVAWAVVWAVVRVVA